jgi:hypothetical protein
MDSGEICSSWRYRDLWFVSWSWAGRGTDAWFRCRPSIRRLASNHQSTAQLRRMQPSEVRVLPISPTIKQVTVWHIDILRGSISPYSLCSVAHLGDMGRRLKRGRYGYFEIQRLRLRFICDKPAIQSDASLMDGRMKGPYPCDTNMTSKKGLL